MEAVQRYGWKDVKSIANHVGTRTPTQARARLRVGPTAFAMRAITLY